MRLVSLLAAALLLPCLPAAPARAQAQVNLKAAERIVTLSPHLAELVCTAGACNKLAGVVMYTDYPAEARRKPLIGDAFNLNYEEIVALRPDLVLAWDGGTSPEAMQRLRQLGLRVQPIRVRNLRDIARALVLIGDLTDSRTSSRLAANLFYKHLDQLRNAHWRKSKVRVMYQIEAEPTYTITDLSPIHEAIKLCGGENVFANLAQIAPAVATESILAADPEVVVFASQDNVAKIREFWTRWPRARAERAGTLYEVNGDLLARQSPRMLDGVDQLCAALDLARGALATRP